MRRRADLGSDAGLLQPMVRGTSAGRIRAVVGILALALAAGCSGGPAGRDAPAAGILELPEHYAHSIAALGFPGARRAFQVGDGSVVSTGECALEWSIPEPGGPVRASPVWFEADGVPIAHWWMVCERESVAFEAAALPVESLGDSNLVVSIRATAFPRTAPTGEVAIEVRVRDRPRGPCSVPWDASGSPRSAWAWDGSLAMRDGLVMAGIDSAARWTLVDSSTAMGLARPPSANSTATDREGRTFLVARAAVAAAPGAGHVWDFWMPAFPALRVAAARLTREAEHPRHADRARGAWRDWLGRASPLHVPDSMVLHAYRAALVTLLQCHERSGEDWVPIGNPFQYRDVWIRDGARTVRALSVAGLTDLARADAWTLRRYQLPDGVLLSQYGQLDGTGEALWAFEQAASLPPSPEWARRFLPIAQEGRRWLHSQRALTRAMELPWPDLLPYGEPRDAEMVRAQLVGNDAWGIAGCRSLERLGALARDPAAAREGSAAHEEYRLAFLAALARTGRADVPASWQGVGRDWGNLAVGYPTGVLPPDDPRLAALAGRLWAADGPGLVTYETIWTQHSYLGTDLAMWALLADRPADARAVLRAVIDHSSSTLSQAEMFARGSGEFAENLPPHATAAAQLVDLIRCMIVCDVRDTLELGLGADLRWWKGTRFEQAPTRFGVVTVRLSRPARDRLEARWSPVRVPTRIRLPDGTRGVAAEGSGVRLVEERWIECAPGTSRATVRIATP